MNMVNFAASIFNAYGDSVRIDFFLRVKGDLRGSITLPSGMIFNFSELNRIPGLSQDDFDFVIFSCREWHELNPKEIA